MSKKDLLKKIDILANEQAKIRMVLDEEKKWVIEITKAGQRAENCWLALQKKIDALYGYLGLKYIERIEEKRENVVVKVPKIKKVVKK